MGGVRAYGVAYAPIMMASGQEFRLRTKLPWALVPEYKRFKGMSFAAAISLALCAGAVSAAAPAATPAPELRSLAAVYLHGEPVRLEVPEGPKPATLGPWRLGTRVLDPKPRDKRLNLYVVAPGTQYHLDGAEDFDHNAIINALPEPGRSREYDVYWALVLDPRLHADFRNERDLIVAAQASFMPGDLFEFDDVPADGVLRGILKMDSLEDLQRYGRKNGTLPRLVIVPAGFAITAAAPETPPEPATPIPATPAATPR